MADWEALNQLATQFLANSALQAQRNRHDIKVQQLNFAVNKQDFLMKELSNKQEQFMNISNADEISRIAFESLNDKFKTAGTSKVVSAVNNVDLESLNSEISDLNEQIKNVEQAKIALGETITDISEAKTLFEEQASLLGTGGDESFEISDLDRLVSDLPTIDDGVGGIRYIASEDLEAARADNQFTEEELNLYDFDKTGTIDDNDLSILSNVEKMIEKREEVGERADATKVYADTMERMKSVAVINELNQMKLFGAKLDDKLTLTMASESKDKAEEKVAGKYTELFNSILQSTTDPTTKEVTTTISDAIKMELGRLMSVENSSVYVADESLREQALDRSMGLINYLITTDPKSFQQRLQILKQNPENAKLVMALENEMTGTISPLLNELKQYQDEYDLWEDVFEQKGGLVLPSPSSTSKTPTFKTTSGTTFQSWLFTK